MCIKIKLIGSIFPEKIDEYGCKREARQWVREFGRHKKWGGIRIGGELLKTTKLATTLMWRIPAKQFLIEDETMSQMLMDVITEIVGNGINLERELDGIKKSAT